MPSARIVAGGGAGTQVTSRKGAQGAEVTSFVPILDAFAADDGALVAENARYTTSHKQAASRKCSGH